MKVTQCDLSQNTISLIKVLFTFSPQLYRTIVYQSVESTQYSIANLINDDIFFYVRGELTTLTSILNAGQLKKLLLASPIFSAVHT